MTFLGELKPFQLNQFNGSELLTFNEKRKLLKESRRRKAKRWMELCYAYWKIFCEKSTIHGLRFLSDNSVLRFEKIIWAIILVASTICGVYSYQLLSQRFQSSRIHTIVNSAVSPVFYTEFPSIGICEGYHINWSKMPAAEKKFLPTNSSRDTIIAFREFIQRFESSHFGRFQHFNNLEASKMELIDNISVLEVMEFLTSTCLELFATDSCQWRQRFYNCCELFKLERTEIGFCHTFNSILTPEMSERAKRDKFYPYRNSKYGEKSGLQATVYVNVSNQRPGSNFSRGVYILFKKADQWHAEPKFIYSNTKASVGVTAQLTEASEEIRAVSPDHRDCLFDDEVTHKDYKKIPKLTYKLSNCRTQCHHDNVIRLCKCRLPLFFPEWTNISFPQCKPKDFICLYNNREILSSTKRAPEDGYVQENGPQMVCTCPTSCVFSLFGSSVATFPRQSINSLEPVQLDIFYSSEYLLKYSTILSYTFVELIGSFGGIIGFFLGASLLSAIEVVYYLTVGFVSFIQKEKTYDAKFKSKRKILKVRPMLKDNIKDSGKILRQKF